MTTSAGMSSGLAKMPGLSSNPHSHHSLRVEGMPMDIEKSRFNMIEQQIRPWDVLDTDVLDLLSVVKREHYVPEAYRALAFVDMEIPLASGQEEALHSDVHNNLWRYRLSAVFQMKTQKGAEEIEAVWNGELFPPQPAELLYALLFSSFLSQWLLQFQVSL